VRELVGQRALIGRRCNSEQFWLIEIQNRIPNMAIYVYETIPKKKGQKPRRFEVEQSMKDDALTKDPKTGLPVKRVITGGSGSCFRGTSILAMNNPRRK